MCRKKNHFQLRYIDVTRVTHTALDVSQECRDEDRDLSEAWTRFTRFPLLSGTHPDGYTWSGGWQEGKQHQGHIICGHKFGQTCHRQLNGKKSKNGRAENRILTMQGCCEAFILPIWKIRNSRKPWRNARKKKYLWKHQCRARSEVVSARKFVVNLTSTDEFIHALWRPRSLRENVWKNSTQRSRW